MAFDFFSKKKEEELPPLGPPAPEPERYPVPPRIPPPGTSPSGVPVQKILDMQAQGLSEDEIISELQTQGYSLPQIESALRQSKGAGAVGGAAPISGAQIFSEKEFEKLAESIVEEKWGTIEERLEKERDWKEKTDTRLGIFEKTLSDLKDTLESLNRAIIGKVEEYDKSLLSVGTEMKAMEKVFKQILPSLTSNVTELSRITKGLKQKKTAKK